MISYKFLGSQRHKRRERSLGTVKEDKQSYQAIRHQLSKAANPRDASTPRFLQAG
jgi:hypothetical protein